jgi:hypothetical protein
MGARGIFLYTGAETGPTSVVKAVASGDFWVDHKLGAEARKLQRDSVQTNALALSST